jgi:hypothetical protein
MEIIVRQIKLNPWSGITSWDNTAVAIGTYYTRAGIVYTGLTAEEARELEKKLGYPEGHLSPNSEFWTTFAPRVGKDDLYLNTESPLHELTYKFLKSHKRVADGMKNVSLTKDVVLISQDAEAEEINKRGKFKRDAYAAFAQMSPEDMRKCVRLFGVNSDAMSTDTTEAKLNEIIDRDPKAFLARWVDNKDKETDFLLEEAVAKNVIRRNRTQYFFGTDLIGTTKEDAIAYLKDKKNQEIKLVILNEINSK